MKRFFHLSSGQTLLEVMIALFVLTTGFLGIMTLFSQSLFLSKNVETETTATYLAEEGIEIAKNLIDHDVYAQIVGIGNGWGTCFGPSGGRYEIDYTTTSCRPHTYLPLDFLVYNPTTHNYLYAYDNPSGNGVVTPFRRLILVTTSGTTEITVNSAVTWSQGGVSQNVNLEDHFYNWYPQ